MPGWDVAFYVHLAPLCFVLNHTPPGLLGICLLQVIHQSSTPHPVTEPLRGVWDVKEWINPLKGHSKYLVFRFTKGCSGNVELHYKHFSDSPWEAEGEGIKVVTVSCVLSFS